MRSKSLFRLISLNRNLFILEPLCIYIKCNRVSDFERGLYFSISSSRIFVSPLQLYPCSPLANIGAKDQFSDLLSLSAIVPRAFA